MTDSRCQHVIMLASAAGCTAADVGCSTQKPRYAGAAAVRPSGFPRASASDRGTTPLPIERDVASRDHGRPRRREPDDFRLGARIVVVLVAIGGAGSTRPRRRTWVAGNVEKLTRCCLKGRICSTEYRACHEITSGRASSNIGNGVAAIWSLANSTRPRSNSPRRKRRGSPRRRGSKAQCHWSKWI